MNRRIWYIAVAVAFAIHNLEEAVAAARLLAFMRSRAPAFLRDFCSGIAVTDLRVSLAILTIVGVVVAAIAARRPSGVTSAFAMLVFAAVIGVNAIAHIALTLAVRAYMPGLITAIVLTLPLAVLLLVRGRREGWVSSAAYWSVIPAAILVHGPVLAGFIRLSITIARTVSRNA